MTMNAEASKKKKGGGGGEGGLKQEGGGRKVMHTVISDERFSKQQTDPRFQRVPMKKKKVTVDARFGAMMGEGSAFSRQSVTDKYGRKVKHEIKEDLSRFYQMEDEEEGQEGWDGKKQGKGKKGQKEEESEGDSEGDSEDESEDESKSKKGKKKAAKKKSNEKQKGKKGKKGDKALPAGMDEVSMALQDQDLRKAMMNWASSSSDDEDEDEEDRLEEERLCAEAIDVSKPLIPVNDYIAQGEETHRLAVVNIDWDRVKAIDLLMLLRSFAPSNGTVSVLKIYVSSFGKERMAHERHFGPGQYIGGGNQAKEGDDSSEDEGEIDMVKLRRYEAEKLQYYYAIAECDSARTAMTIYDQCDGVEYEASSNVMDIRYVPDSVTFDDAPSSQASGEAPPDYVSPFFVNKALGHTKCDLTWDMDDPERNVLKGKNLSGKGKKKQRNAEMDAIDYSAFVESSDDEEEEDAAEEERRSKARAMLLQGDGDAFGNKGAKEEEEGGDMQITFTPGLGALGEGLVKKKEEREAEEGMSTWEKYQKKKDDRKAEVKKQRKGADDEGGAKDLPEDSEFVDDSFFADDPFFALPGEAEGGEEEKGKGLFKKKKLAREAAAKEAEEKRSKARAEREKKEEEMEMLKKVMGNTGEKRGYEIKHASLGRASQRAGEEEGSGKKKKGKKRRAGEEEAEEDSFKLNVDDSRFSAVYSNPKFALDPTDPNFRKTPGLSKLLDAGREKRSKGSVAPPAERKEKEGKAGAGQKEGKKRDSELAALVTSLKGKKWGAGGK